MATATTIRNTQSSGRGPAVLSILIVLYALSGTLSLLALKLPQQLAVGSQIGIAALFALVHGCWVYRWRGILVFSGICFLICNMVESIGVLTGFPFGAYYFTGAMGPRLFDVPFTMSLAYLAIGYSSWTIALLILNRNQNKITGQRVISVPALAACIMVVWDFSSEPQWSTISHLWVWSHGGSYFGVPVANFAGWFVTDLMIFVSFAVYLTRRANAVIRPAIRYSRLAVFSFFVVIAANVVTSIPLLHSTPVPDATGFMWSTSSIAINTIFISIFMMGAFAALAWRRLSGQYTAYENAQA